LWGLVAKWRKFLQGEDSGAEKDLQRARKTGRPLVDHEHFHALRKRPGATWRRGNQGGNRRIPRNK
jgi:hypothetical protein